MNPVSYLQGVVAELRKVVWPTPTTVLKYFLSVVIGVAIATVIVGSLDYIFIHALGLIINK